MILNATPCPIRVYPSGGGDTGLLYHNNFNSTIVPVVGSAFDTSLNVGYAATASGTGLDCNQGSSTYGQMTNQTNVKSMFVDHRYTIEYTVKYTGFSIINGVVQGNSTINTAFMFSTTTFNMIIYHYHRASDAGIAFWIDDGTNPPFTQKLTNINVALNGEIKWAISHDTNGIDGGSDTLRIYADEGSGYNLKFSTTTTLDFLLNTYGTYYDFTLAASRNALTTNYLRGVMDDFKTYNYAKTY